MEDKMFFLVFASLLLCVGIFGQQTFGIERENKYPAALPEAATFTVAAKIYDGREDERETALSTKFYVFKKSFVEILKSKHFTPTDADGSPLAGETDYFEAFVEAAEGGETFDAEPEEAALLGWLIESAYSRDNTKNRNFRLTMLSPSYSES